MMFLHVVQCLGGASPGAVPLPTFTVLDPVPFPSCLQADVLADVSRDVLALGRWEGRAGSSPGVNQPDSGMVLNILQRC